MIAVGIASGHVLLSDWLFLIAAVLVGLLGIAHLIGNSGTSIATARSAAIQCIALALVALGLMFL